MSRPPRVSIAIPVYNGGDLFRETLDSFLSQTFCDFEILISDNASTDQTEEIGREYVAKDPRVQYYRNEKNVGLGPNHNRIFGLARGDYFKWSPADDLYAPTYLERCVQVLDSDPSIVIAYPKTRFINVDGEPLSIEDPGWHLISESAAERFRYVLRPRGHWANVILGLIRTEALARTRLMPAYPGGDFRVIGELSLVGKFFEVPEYLFFRRLHERSSSQHVKDLSWETVYWNGRGEKLPWPFLHLKADYLQILVQSRLTVREKISVFGSLVRSIIGGRKSMLEEMQMHANFYFRKRAF
ncbi:MAG TPA: glycosyltransferase family 2 protein [Terriglobales bacterium]|nr:glycosyltransferase family 2 protein [Terriglobales bacterium]